MDEKWLFDVPGKQKKVTLSSVTFSVDLQKKFPGSQLKSSKS